MEGTHQDHQSLHRTAPRITACAWSTDTWRTVGFCGSKHSVRPWIIQNSTIYSNKNIALAVEHCLTFLSVHFAEMMFFFWLNTCTSSAALQWVHILGTETGTLHCLSSVVGAHGHWSNFPASKQGICNITAQPTTRLEPVQPPHCWYNCVTSILYAFFTSKVSSPQSDCIS